MSKIVHYTSEASVYLVGSYATNTASKGSDIDLLVFLQQPQQTPLVTYLNGILPDLSPILVHKLDCKILTWTDYKKGFSTHYLFLYSMISHGKCFARKKINIKLYPDLLNQNLSKLIDQRVLLEENIGSKTNFDMTAYLLFQTSKSLHHLERLITPSDFLSLKKVWNHNLVFLGTIYEKFSLKGISTSLSSQIKFGKQRSGNYHRLLDALIQLQQYEERVHDKFRLWYEQNDIL